jgi:hypothetical protein
LASFFGRVSNTIQGENELDSYVAFACSWRALRAVERAPKSLNEGCQLRTVEVGVPPELDQILTQLVSDFYRKAL